MDIKLKTGKPLPEKPLPSPIIECARETVSIEPDLTDDQKMLTHLHKLKAVLEELNFTIYFKDLCIHTSDEFVLIHDYRLAIRKTLAKNMINTHKMFTKQFNK